MSTRKDIVVMGGSAGGVEPLCQILKSLPPSYPGTVLVVLHIGEHSYLPQVLERACQLPVRHPTDRQPVEPGRVFVAPPNRHMLLEHGALVLSSGPHENRHRPAIDPLFRSAARIYRERVASVLLSGWMDDGAAGTFFVHSRGGTTIVQDPEEALADAMPRNALKHTRVDHVLPSAEIGPLLVRLATRPDEKGDAEMREEPEEVIVNSDAPLVCPDCGGPLTRSTHGTLTQYRCQIGHVFSPENLDEAHRQALERALWIAIRTLDERSRLHFTLANDPGGQKPPGVVRRMIESAEAAARDVLLLRQILDTLW